jgi:hypothetical protein
MASTTSQIRIVFDGTARGVVAAAAEARTAISLLDNTGKSLQRNFGRLGLDKLDRGASKLLVTLGKTAAITSAVAAGGGLVGQAFAAALPAVTALGVAGATVALGLDGIKKSAEQLEKPFDDLKKNVSGAFEQALTPIFARLVPIIPKLSGGFAEMAISISGVAGKLVDVVASARGVELLKDTIKGAQQFIVGLGDGLARFLDGFLSAVASARGEMRGLGDAVGSVFGKVGDVLRTLANDDVGTFSQAVAGASSVIRGLGNVIAPVVDLAVRLGAALGDSIGVVLDNLGQGIQNASPGLVDLGRAVGDLLKAAAPLLPVIGQLASAFASQLADAVRAVTPYVRDFADWATNNVGTVKAIAETILILVAGFKALSIAQSVVGWVNGAITAVRNFGTAAATAGTKAEAAAVSGGKLKGALTGWGALGAAVALAAAAEGMDRLNVSAAGGAEHLTGVKENLHDLTGAAHELLSGDFGRIGDEFAQQMDETIRNIQSGKSAFGEFLGFIKRSISDPLPPLNFNVDTGPGRTQVRKFLDEINQAAPQVNINGNTTGAGFALREIIDEISRGKGEVVIDGRPIPAQEALAYVIGLINNGVGEVNINGNNVPAGQALADFLSKAQGSTATAQLNADPTKARETVGGWTRFTEGTTGIAQMSANPAQANSVLAGWKTVTSATVGVAHLNAEPGQANAALAGWKGSANATVGVAHLNAEPGGANATTSGWQGAANRTTATAHLNAEGSSANSVLQSIYNAWAGRVINWFVHIIGGVAHGGPIITGRAGGGAIRGPGTGTSDTAGLFRLSHGEHVLTAREVQAAGGHAAIFALRRQLIKGAVPRMANAGRVATGGAITSASGITIPAPQVNVAVHIDGNEVRSIVRTEISVGWPRDPPHRPWR